MVALAFGKFSTAGPAWASFSGENNEGGPAAPSRPTQRKRGGPIMADEESKNNPEMSPEEEAAIQGEMFADLRKSAEGIQQSAEEISPLSVSRCSGVANENDMAQGISNPRRASVVAQHGADENQRRTLQCGVHAPGLRERAEPTPVARRLS
jgi:hypothetical protein